MVWGWNSEERGYGSLSGSRFLRPEVGPPGLCAARPCVCAQGRRSEVVIDHLDSLMKGDKNFADEEKIKLVAGYPEYAGSFDEIILDKRRLLSESPIRFFIWRGEGEWEVQEYEPLKP